LATRRAARNGAVNIVAGLTRNMRCCLMPQASANLIPATTTRNRRRVSAVENADPIFAAIAAHRDAVAAYWKDPGNDAAWDAMGYAELAMTRTKPTTVSGVVAYLNHVARCETHSLFGDDRETNDRVRVFICDVRDGLKG
jgi:hypothetical protein